MRALTVTAQHLVPEGEAAEQLDFFSADSLPRRDRLERLERAVDQVRRKYGHDALSLASSVNGESLSTDPPQPPL